jgi:hypothetical protein
VYYHEKVNGAGGERGAGNSIDPNDLKLLLLRENANLIIYYYLFFFF